MLRQARLPITRRQLRRVPVRIVPHDHDGDHVVDGDRHVVVAHEHHVPDDARTMPPSRHRAIEGRLEALRIGERHTDRNRGIAPGENGKAELTLHVHAHSLQAPATERIETRLAHDLEHGLLPGLGEPTRDGVSPHRVEETVQALGRQVDEAVVRQASGQREVVGRVGARARHRKDDRLGMTRRPATGEAANRADDESTGNRRGDPTKDGRPHGAASIAATPAVVTALTVGRARGLPPRPLPRAGSPSTGSCPQTAG